METGGTSPVSTRLFLSENMRGGLLITFFSKNQTPDPGSKLCLRFCRDLILKFDPAAEEVETGMALVPEHGCHPIRGLLRLNAPAVMFVGAGCVCGLPHKKFTVFVARTKSSFSPFVVSSRRTWRKPWSGGGGLRRYHTVMVCRDPTRPLLARRECTSIHWLPCIYPSSSLFRFLLQSFSSPVVSDSPRMMSAEQECRPRYTGCFPIRVAAGRHRTLLSISYFRQCHCSWDAFGRSAGK